jgi:haloalkane dehalogenase
LGLHSGLTLVMQDWGGMVGMGFARRHPERVARLVVLNAAAFHVPAGMRVPFALRVARDTALGTLLVRGSNLFIRTAARVCCQRRPLPRPVRAAYLAPYDSWAHRIAVLRFPQDVPLAPGDRSYDLVGQIERDLVRFAHLPTLICWGERDYVFPPPVLDLWLRHWPNAQVLRLPDCGHWVLEDAPDEIADRMRQFLT